MTRTVLDVGTEHDLSKDFIVGAARIVFAPMTTAVPTDLPDIIYMSTASNANEVQTLTVTGTPTGGTFKLQFRGYKTAAIAYNATAAAVQAALELLSTIGTGGVVATGGPLPGTPVVLTFSSQLGNTNVPSITIVNPAFTGGTTPVATIAVTTPGVGIYDVKPGWFDLGPTLGGITVTHNNGEQTYTIDQINADIFTLPNSTEMSVSAAVSRNDIDTMQLLFEGDTITVNGTTGNRFLPLGPFSTYTQRRVVILSQRPSLDGGITPGGVRGVFFRISQRSPQEASLVYNKEGTQQTVAFTWKALADTTVTNERARFGGVFDEK
jgi:hypothetical protein